MERLSFNSAENPSLRDSDEALVGSAAERRDMYERWLAFVATSLYKYSLSPSTQRDTAFRLSAHRRRAGGASLARFTTVKGKSQLFRSSAEIGADGCDGYVLYMPLRGEIEIEQCNRKYLYGPGSAVLVSAAEPLIHTKLGDNDTLCLRMPREFVDERALRAEHCCVRPLRDNGITRLFIDTMLAFGRDADALSEQEFCVTSRLVGELALLALGSSAEPSSDVRSVRTSNLARAKRAMRMRLGDPDLTLAEIANSCGISLRYLHDLFRDESMTAREYLQGERLQRARLMLQSASGRGVTVTSVSLACGFANSSQFSTSFRRAYGLSPRDVLRRR